MARTSGWTVGRRLATRATSVVLWAAIACGPVGLAMGVVAAPSAPAGATAAPVSLSDDRVTRASALAVTFVGAWLTATTEDPEPLVTLLPVATVESARPTAYRDLTVVATEGPDDGGIVAVTVGGLIDEGGPPLDPLDPTGAPTSTGATSPRPHWVPRHFQVTVATTGGLAVVAEPALVSVPDASPHVVDASVQLPTSDAAATAAALFLSAYLTASPDLERFVAPGAHIAAHTSAPYVAVDVRDVRSSQPPAPQPVGGERLDLRVSAAALTRAESTHILTYWLTLEARDGRWEVTAIGLGPPTATDATPL